jgi:phosphonate transport system substrate-binding protein
MALVRFLRPGCLLFWLLGGLGGGVQAAQEQPVYSVLVTPQLAPETMHKAWAPLLDAVTRETGIKFTLSIPPSVAQADAQLLRGLPDFAFINPYMVLPARKAHGYVPLLRNGRNKLVGQLLVRDDSPVKTLRDLDGATIAFPSANAYAAALYLRAELARENVRFTPVYAATHSNVYRRVLLGRAAAGGGVNTSLARESADVRSRLRAVYSTPPLMPHPLAGHPRVPAAVREAVVTAILRLAAWPAHRQMFDASQIPDPVTADYARDYASMEALGLEKFLVLDKN